MATISENVATWTNYPWSKQGDEWSEAWAGSAMMWWGSLFPRIHFALPTATILEIAPGFGRCTHYLKDFCKHLVVVDLTQRCIDACKQRFSSCDHITYHVNDGTSLSMIADHSIDFVFSYDSLVHAESDVLQAYLHQLATKLKPNGVGFLHHSNLGSFVDPETGTLPFENIHWRAQSMSAKRFVEYCEESGLQCIGQEIINWGGEQTIDSFSLFTPKHSALHRPNVIIENPHFMDEAARLAYLAQIYHPAHFAPFAKVGSVGFVSQGKSLSKRDFALQRLRKLIRAKVKSLYGGHV